MNPEQISMQQLYQKTQSLQKGEVILDVRSAEEFASGHVPGAINIPHDSVDAHVAELKKYARVYIHCQAGGRAGRAASRLSELGLTNLVCVSGGGMGDWLASGYPVAHGKN
jgi:rhodanese-related sulfurtransferase